MANAQNGEGIINPSADELIKKAESKYGLVIFGARRARQINAYYAQLHENLYDQTGPLLESEPNEKSLSVAMREINEGLIEARHIKDGQFDENGNLLMDEEPSVFLTSDQFYLDEPFVEYVDAPELGEEPEQA